MKSVEKRKSSALMLFVAVTVVTAAVMILPIVYFIPRVIMEIARYRLTGVETVTDQGRAPMNRVSHTHRTPTAKKEDRVIVRMNVDTFYSSGWFNLKNGPVIIHVPATDGRYYSLQFNDAYTNAFAFIGKRTTGSGEGYFALTGPGWKGELPSGVKRIDAPTNLVWMIGRTMFYGKEDIEYVKQLQSGITFTSLDKFKI
ncbi:MAG TPA: DUF1254 domain-containing protein [Spirochaetes bacterium]|nr:DUF1254 domain-containing protein [Spirochaetota bacterium]